MKYRHDMNNSEEFKVLAKMYCVNYLTVWYADIMSHEFSFNTVSVQDYSKLVFLMISITFTTLIKLQ